MQPETLKIGNVVLPTNIIQAPLAGYTDFFYRENCLRFGAGLCFTEMVSAKGLYYGSEKTEELLKPGKTEKIKATQIFGSDADIMRAVCESETLAPFDIIDINMGCPVPKIYKNGEGSALMEKPKLAEKIVSECVKSGKVVTVKTRIGIHEGDKQVYELAKAVENGGASAITVHGRVKDAYYSGDVDFESIAKVKQSVKIPVIANGGVFDKRSCDELKEKTGADGIMIARGSIGKPWIFAEVTGKETRVDVKKEMLNHLNALSSAFGEKYACTNFRKFFAYYLKGIPCKEQKIRLMTACSLAEINEIISEIDF